MSAIPLDPRVSGATSESIGSNLAGIFAFLIDPSAAARRLFTRWFWAIPLVAFILVSGFGTAIVMPMIRHVLEIQPPPPNVSPDAFARQVEFGIKLQSILSWMFPIVIVFLQALILWGMASMTAVDANYRQMLNLASGGSVISAFGAIAGVVILKIKGELSTMAELRPAMGLDIFLPEGTNKFLIAFVGYFSVFEIWWIVMMVLILSSAYRISKVKAFIIVSPIILLSLAFRLMGAVAQRS